MRCVFELLWHIIPIKSEHCNNNFITCKPMSPSKRSASYYRLIVLFIVQKATQSIGLTKVIHGSGQEREDVLAIEEPLEIRLAYQEAGISKVKSISVTMRTPGHTADLATGFLYTEGIINSIDQISAVGQTAFTCAENKENIIQVTLEDGVVPHLQNTDRNFYTTSSCGVCGKGSINAIRTVSSTERSPDDLTISADQLYGLPRALREQQAVFDDTGGLHACALFNTSGDLLFLREDVGRHNALDKLIGASLQMGQLPLNDHILLLSGRASFELIQKAAMADIRIVAAIGAPSSLAVQLAEEFNITLIGFLRDQRFNIYTLPHRILLSVHENSY